MGTCYYMIDQIHETRFNLDKRCGWFPPTGEAIRKLGRDGLIALCLKGIAEHHPMSRSAKMYWRSVGEWLWAFCENANFNVLLIDDASGGDEEWWDWPVVLDRCRRA